MRVALTVRSLFVLAAAFVIALGGPARTTGAHGDPIVYASIIDSGIASYDALTGRQLGRLRTHNAFGVAVDGAQNVYVGVTNADPGSFLVDVYAPGATKPSRRISTGQQYANLAVSSGGELAVSGFGGYACCGNSFDFFEPGQTKPSRTIAPTSTFATYGSVAYDAAGNCWVDGLDANNQPAFGYVAPGATTVTVVPFAGAVSAGLLAVAPDGNIVLANQGGLVQVYTPAGALTFRWRLMGAPAAIGGIAIAGSRLFVASGATQLSAYHYPSGRRLEQYFGWYSNGVAVEN
jgi:hypothetical protein